MTTVQSKVTDGADLVPFFYLRITGFPFYVFCTVNPADSKYGSFAWSAPTGFPATWAQRGLQLPDDTIEQKFTDIIGGVASPGRCRLSVIDFRDPLHPGFGYFSRLFAAGRTLSDSSIPNGLLADRISAVPGEDTVILVNGTNVTWPNNADIYIGAETIGTGTNSNDGGGAWELPIVARNKYVCFGNSADGGAFWPPIPYHRTGVAPDGTAVPGAAPIVAGDVMDVLGRTAALWMGHMRPDGLPEPESSSACLILGRVSGLEMGSVGGMFDITIDSIVGDLTKALIAPDLAQGTIQPSLYLNDPAWCSFYLISEFEGSKTIAITPGAYTQTALVNEVNAQIGATLSSGRQYVTLQLIPAVGGSSFQFVSSLKGISFGLSTIPGLAFGGTPDANTAPSSTSLLYALGFDPSSVLIQVSATSTDFASTVAPRAAATVFVPTSNIGTQSTLTLVEPFVGGYFFNNQNDGSGKAWVIFGDSEIVQLVSAPGGAANTVVTGQVNTALATSGGFYYVDPGGTGTIAQIMLFDTLTSSASQSFTHFIGMLLAATRGEIADGDLNAFPEGVGLGWFKLLTPAEWSISDESGVPRLAYIDATTSFTDLFTPYAREHGLFIVWDPSAGQIRLRRFQVPTQAGSTIGGTATAAFTESNRASDKDRTTQRADRTSLRTSWKIQAALSLVIKNPAFGAAFGSGFGPTAGSKRTSYLDNSQAPPPVVLVDLRARSMYPNDARQEEINDKTLISFPDLGDIVAQLIRLYGSPWTLCQRSMNKRGMFLAPGTIHQIVDNTMVNPFTGAYGITADADVYCFLTRVAVSPSTGAVTIEFVINSSNDQSLYRQWSPTALVDFSLNAGGYTHGYKSSTKQLSTVVHYGTNASGDGADFFIGDTVRVIARDSGMGTIAEQTDTIAGVSGGVIQLTTGISALSTISESVVILQKYNSATASRQAGATRVSWQGDGATRTIQGNATARLSKWA